MGVLSRITTSERRLIGVGLRRRLRPWLAASLEGVALAFVGYSFGYRGIGRIEGGPDDLSHSDRLAVVPAEFGGFLAHGGAGIDRAVMPDADAPTSAERDAGERTDDPALQR